MIQAWHRGVEFCEGIVKAGVREPLDVVVTSCAGYPLDTTWYQAVKGLTGALPIVKQGGTIVMAASLSEGLGSPEFQGLLNTSNYMHRFLPGGRRGPIADTCEMDEWQLVMLAKVLDRCKVKVISDGLPPETLRRCLVEPFPTVEQAVAASLAEYGPKARLAVIPKGPYVLPYVAG
jgi:nickel-dependent lactate racemase